MIPTFGIEHLRPGRTGRCSSWDRTGGNKDFVTIPPGETYVAADIEGPGKITHLWFTGWQHYRDLLIRITWDDTDEPSIFTPYGDFFGHGNGFVNTFQSLWFTSSTDKNNQQGKLTASNCYLPMPFRKRAKVEFVNEGDKDARQYFYIDYETYESESDLGPDPAYLHAEFRMERPFGGWGPELWPNSPEVDNIRMLGREAWDTNYVLTEVKGRGHYIGCFFNVVNLQAKAFGEMTDAADADYSWWGEGDEMIWVDGYSWPPDIHGTGSEDYFNQAMGMQRNAFLRNGTAVHEFDTLGYSTSYVFHVENPVRFQKELKATIEIGHANHLGNDISSVSFFYLDKPAGVLPPPAKDIRRSIEKVDGEWQITDRNRYTTKTVPMDEAKQLELDQGRRMLASDPWICQIGRLIKTDSREIAFLPNQADGDIALLDLLIDVAESASGAKAPTVLLNLFGHETCVQLTPETRLNPEILSAVESNLDKTIKVTAGVLLDQEIERHPDAVCTVTLHDRITFRDK